MNVTETINDILDKGATTITIGRVPDDKDKVFSMAEVKFPTGSTGNNMQARCQRVGRSLPECLTALRGDLYHMDALNQINKS